MSLTSQWRQVSRKGSLSTDTGQFMPETMGFPATVACSSDSVCLRSDEREWQWQAKKRLQYFSRHACMRVLPSHLTLSRKAEHHSQNVGLLLKNWCKSIHLDQPEESVVCMAGDLSAVAISWSAAGVCPCVVLQLLQPVHCSGDRPLWWGTPAASRPYGRLGSRWRTPPCRPCTVYKPEWCTARRSPAGTSPPAQSREIIARLRWS